MSTSTYRSLLRLYPEEFRRDYGDDLVQIFADRVHDQGPRRAWARTTTDLVVTVPRYRLEHLMTEQQSATTLTVATVALAASGALSLMAGIYPGAVLLIAAAGLAVAQGSTLARAIRTPSSSRRRRRLGIAAVLTLVFVATMASWMQAIDGDHISGTSLVLHNAIGIPAMLGAVAFLVAGLLTPSAPRNRSTAGAS